jgi:hypothetical protein
LFHTYWRPVYAFVRRNGYDPDQSQDLTHGFFALACQIRMSAGAMSMSVHRMRRRYRRLLREEITETVARPDDIDDEIRFLVSTLSA